MDSALAFPKIKEPQAIAKMPPRKSRPEKLVLTIVFQQMAEQGIFLKCNNCGAVLTLDNIRGEHLTPREQTVPGVDPDRPENQRYWCLDPCSKKKDKRDAKTKAKERRILKQTKGSRKPKAKIKSKGFQKGEKKAWPKRALAAASAASQRKTRTAQ